MEISMNNSSTLPDFNNYTLNEKQFCSFKYESVIEGENETENRKRNKINNSKEHYQEKDIEMNFLESLEESNKINEETDSESESESESDSEYESLDEAGYVNDNHYDNGNDDDNDNDISKPINIINKKINFDTNSFEFIFDTKDKTSNEFEIIYPEDFRPTSLPLNNKTITESFKDYLYSSISLIKQSYNYISSNKSI